MPILSNTRLIPVGVSILACQRAGPIPMFTGPASIQIAYAEMA